MELLKKINIEYSQYKKYLYKKLTTYTMISIKNKVKSNQVIRDSFKLKINELLEIVSGRKEFGQRAHSHLAT